MSPDGKALRRDLKGAERHLREALKTVEGSFPMLDDDDAATVRRMLDTPNGSVRMPNGKEVVVDDAAADAWSDAFDCLPRDLERRVLMGHSLRKLRRVLDDLEAATAANRPTPQT